MSRLQWPLCELLYDQSCDSAYSFDSSYALHCCRVLSSTEQRLRHSTCPKSTVLQARTARPAH